MAGGPPAASGGSNPFDMGFGNDDFSKRPGPSAESWHKDGVDLGKEIRVDRPL